MSPLPAPRGSSVTAGGMSNSTQCQNPLPVGASGSKQVTANDAVSGGCTGPAEMRGHVVAGHPHDVGEMQVRQRLARLEVVARDRQSGDRRQEVVGKWGAGGITHGDGASWAWAGELDSVRTVRPSSESHRAPRHGTESSR